MFDRITTVVEIAAEPEGCLPKVIGGVVLVAVLCGIVWKVDSCTARRAEERQRAENDVTETIRQDEADAKRQIAAIYAELENARKRRAEAAERAEAERIRNEARLEAEAEAAAKAAKAAAEAQDRRRILSEFALESAPGAWRDYLALEARLAELDRKLAQTRKSFADAGRDAFRDEAFSELRSLRNDTLRRVRWVESAWRDAYAAHVGWTTSPADSSLAKGKEAALARVAELLEEDGR